MFCFGSFSPPYYFGQVISLIENVIIPPHLQPPRRTWCRLALDLTRRRCWWIILKVSCASLNTGIIHPIWKEKNVCVCAFSVWYVGQQAGLKKKKREMFFRACVLFCQGVLDDVSLVMVRSDPGGCFIRYPSINSCNIHLHQPDQSSFPPKMSTPALHQPSSCPSLLQSLSSWFFHLH